MPILTTTSASASRSTAAEPRKPCSSLAPRRLASISRTSSRSTGSRRTAVSRKASTHTPPRPTATTMPQSGSRAVPTKSSMPASRIGVTSTPSRRACGAAWRTAVSISCHACATCASPRSRSRTPPMSVLCVMSGEAIFSATRPPKRRAHRAPSSAERVISAGITGTPKRSRYASTSRSELDARSSEGIGVPSSDPPGRGAAARVCAARNRADHQIA